uniref:Pheromone binding protein n=1 Tax=Ascotis selenaria cretacea TaxID=414917 RepID=A5LH86_9NEOP|nr:pheromone binding protein [Ascotis selenaria cretacea]
MQRSWCFYCRLLVVLGVFLALVQERECSQEVMHNLSKGFAEVLEDCKKQENVGDHIMQDFYNFWHEEYSLVNREMGCIILCMAGKLDLLDGDTMHHGNAHEFAKKHGADDALAKQLVGLVHECEQASASVEERCARALETTKCFRGKIHGLKWAPSMRVVMEEVMADM